ncbi:MAG: DUF5777 family beta-barrel protein [Acidobacteriota bacterium]
MTRLPWICTALLVFGTLLAGPSPARAQDDDAAALRLAEPDFTLIALPTSLRLPPLKSAFRVTHRFTRPLNDDFGDVASDLFGLDTGATIGLEYRFGVIPNGQIGFYRTSNKTIELFSQYRVLPQSRSLVDVSAYFSIEGTNNFKDSYSPTVGAIVSRTFGDLVAVYVEPMWVNNTNQLPKAVVDHNDTFMVGFGARVRVRPSVYLVAEAAPRPSGYKPGITQGSFAIEKRAGGHSFQLNFSNSFGTTMAQIARGGPVDKDWFLGFNISRKFY